jgi:hypothetical protein
VRALLVLVIVAACGSSSKDTAPPPPSSPSGSAAPTAASTTVKVDRRVELLSFVNALAGFKEYTMGQANPYRTAFVAYFRPFAGHAAVQHAKRLRAEKGIGYDAPMILAVHLDEKLELVNAAELPDLDKRWAGVDAEAYAKDLRAFAADAKLDEFLASHAGHYKKIEDALRTAVDAERPSAWFDKLLGARDKARFTVIPGPMTGTYNFGVRATRPDGTSDLYQILGVDTPTGLPVVNDELVFLLVHETGHSYVNPVLAQHEAALAAPAQKLFAQVEQQMRSQAYPTWQIFLAEQVVRAATYAYFVDKKGSDAAAKLLAQERERGFLWTAEIAALLRERGKDYVAHLSALLEQLGQR